MKKKSKVEEKSSLELKYCERCGGLWLRPTGGEQIYCVVCARQMAEMPPPLRLDSSSADHGQGDAEIHAFEKFRSEKMSGNSIGGEL